MLIELQDVEAHINPTEVVQQALETKDIYADELISMCMDQNRSVYAKMMIEQSLKGKIKAYNNDKVACFEIMLPMEGVSDGEK